MHVCVYIYIYIYTLYTYNQTCKQTPSDTPLPAQQTRNSNTALAARGHLRRHAPAADAGL